MTALKQDPPEMKHLIWFAIIVASVIIYMNFFI